MHFRPVTLLNIYRPNQDYHEFFQKVLGLILDISNTNLITGVDFNQIDCTCKAQAPPTYVHQDYESASSMDFRISNTTGREYSLHSHVHDVYTRIDYSLVDGKLNIIIRDDCTFTFCSAIYWFSTWIKCFCQGFDNGEVPHTMNEATITMIPKKGKDLEEVGSQRPISLLNLD